MVGSIILSGKEYRWLFSVRASQLFNDLYGKPEETTDRLKAFELNTRFLYCCIKASDELRLIDGQDTQLGDMGIGATTYTNSNLIGASDLEVYREGLIQYKIGDNYFSFNSGTGTVTVFPPVSVNERFSIWVV